MIRENSTFRYVAVHITKVIFFCFFEISIFKIFVLGDGKRIVTRSTCYLGGFLFPFQFSSLKKNCPAGLIGHYDSRQNPPKISEIGLSKSYFLQIYLTHRRRVFRNQSSSTARKIKYELLNFLSSLC